MALERYKNLRFNTRSQLMIKLMNGIIADYVAQGYRLTVRQLYYQLVARELIQNNERSYKRVTSLVNDARLAGLMDWDAIEDRTRAFIRRTRWESGRQILNAATDGFHMDMWANQPNRVFVIVEKEALVGVLERVCDEYDVPVLAARGYPSGTVLRDFVERDVLPALETQEITILHLGDHDPSGIDMTRDLRERIDLFAYDNPVEFKRIALNMPQIIERKPPPNPAKVTDSRFKAYRRKHGDESWELDALPPEYLSELLRNHITGCRVESLWEEREAEVEAVREKLAAATEKFEA